MRRYIRTYVCVTIPRHGVWRFRAAIRETRTVRMHLGEPGGEEDIFGTDNFEKREEILINL